MAITGPEIAAKAEKYIGDPYVYGADGPNRFDCSGLVYYVFRQLGASVPRTSEEQATAGKAVTKAQLVAGDLVFAAGSDGTSTHPGHVGIYDGKGGVIEAPHTGENVRTTPLSQFDAVSYRRMSMLDDAGAAAAGASLGAGIEQGIKDSGIPGLSSLSSLFSFPSDITGFFSQGTSDLAALGSWFGAFTRPSTWVRIGSGLFGVVFLIFGLFFLARGGRDNS